MKNVDERVRNIMCKRTLPSLLFLCIGKRKVCCVGENLIQFPQKTLDISFANGLLGLSHMTCMIILHLSIGSFHQK